MVSFRVLTSASPVDLKNRYTLPGLPGCEFRIAVLPQLWQDWHPGPSPQGTNQLRPGGLIFLCCGHKPGEMWGAWYPSAAWKDQCYQQDQNVTWRIHICSLPYVLEEAFGRPRTCRIPVCVPPAFGDEFCILHIYYMDTLTVHSLTHVTLYLPNFGHELSIRLQTLALWY